MRKAGLYRSHTTNDWQAYWPCPSSALTPQWANHSGLDLVFCIWSKCYTFNIQKQSASLKSLQSSLVGSALIQVKSGSKLLCSANKSWDISLERAHLPSNLCILMFTPSGELIITRHMWVIRVWDVRGGRLVEARNHFLISWSSVRRKNKCQRSLCSEKKNTNPNNLRIQGV